MLNDTRTAVGTCIQYMELLSFNVHRHMHIIIFTIIISLQYSVCRATDVINIKNIVKMCNVLVTQE